MNQFEHTMIAMTIMILLLHLWLKDYFISGKEEQEWRDFFK
jgi:hypothetical protein